MNVKRILLTGDDGYNAVGVRILIHFLKNDFNLCIAGTKVQQSGVGGYKSIPKKITWGEDTIDGVRAFWVDGSPVDAVEGAKKYYKEQFDLVISGINLGVNIGGCLISSGTFAGAFHGVNLGLASRSIAISWDVPSDLYFKDHSKKEDISLLLFHPGESANQVIRKTIDEKYWGATLVNINIPIQKTNKAVFTRPLEKIDTLWPGPILDTENNIFSYGFGDHSVDIGKDGTDLKEINKGLITISPCQTTMVDTSVYEKMKDTEIRL